MEYYIIVIKIEETCVNKLNYILQVYRISQKVSK